MCVASAIRPLLTSKHKVCCCRSIIRARDLQSQPLRFASLHQQDAVAQTFPPDKHQATPRMGAFAETYRCTRPVWAFCTHSISSCFSAELSGLSGISTALAPGAVCGLGQVAAVRGTFFFGLNHVKSLSPPFFKLGVIIVSVHGKKGIFISLVLKFNSRWALPTGRSCRNVTR